MNACELTRLETELRVAIRRALRCDLYGDTVCSRLYADYCANNGPLLYDGIYRDEAAQIGVVLDENGKPA